MHTYIIYITKNVFNGQGDNPILIFIPQHGVCLPTGGLAVSKNGT